MQKPLLIIVAALVGYPASAAGNESAPVKPKEQLLCQERVPIGSRLNAKRICLTKREWDQVRGQHRRELDRFVTDSMAIKDGPASPR